jgi:GDP-L-fucose synthase
VCPPRPDFRVGSSRPCGSAICQNLSAHGYDSIVTVDRSHLDLTNQSAVSTWFVETRPEYVHLVAGKVGRIDANSTFPADFIYENLMIHATVIEASRQVDVTKLLYLGSSCIYPRDAAQPLVEESLLTGPLEKTNEGYALAKIAGIKMCETYRRQHGCDFISAMPTNLYGPGDNFDLKTSHVLPALMRKFHESRTAGSPAVQVWGTGTPMREFLHVDDLADACRHLMNV